LAVKCFSLDFSWEDFEELATDCGADGGTASCWGAGFVTSGVRCGVAGTGKRDVADITGLFSGFGFSFAAMGG
jgi:hypothetical protein